MPNRPSEILDRNRERIRQIVSRHRSANPRIFGSVLHGTDTQSSDLDIIVDLLPGDTLFDLGGLHSELEEVLGLQVDLLTPGDLPRKYRDEVLQEAEPV